MSCVTIWTTKCHFSAGALKRYARCPMAGCIPRLVLLPMLFPHSDTARFESRSVTWRKNPFRVGLARDCRKNQLESVERRTWLLARMFSRIAGFELKWTHATEH